MTGRTTKADARREEILKAAGACFREKGLRGASISDICTRLKISPGHLYYYFKSKDAIVEALLDQMREAQMVDIDRELAASPGVMDFFLSGEYVQRVKMPEEVYLDITNVWEVYAEAERRPKSRIAQLVHDHWGAADAVLRKRIEADQAVGRIRADADVEVVLTSMCMAIVTMQMARFADPNFSAERYVTTIRHILEPFAVQPAASARARRRA